MWYLQCKNYAECFFLFLTSAASLMMIMSHAAHFPKKLSISIYWWALHFKFQFTSRVNHVFTDLDPLNYQNIIIYQTSVYQCSTIFGKISTKLSRFVGNLWQVFKLHLVKIIWLLYLRNSITINADKMLSSPKSYVTFISRRNDDHFFVEKIRLYQKEIIQNRCFSRLWNFSFLSVGDKHYKQYWLLKRFFYNENIQDIRFWKWSVC